MLTRKGDREMRKIFKIILALFALLVIFVVAFGAIVFLDVTAYTATSSQNLSPTGTAVGKALVVYDPGLSGAAKNVASKVAGDLQAAGYAVTLAGIKSSAASNTSTYNIIVVGGPIYVGIPTGSVKDFLGSQNPAQGVKLGVFGSGQGSTTPADVQQIKDSIASLKNGSSLSNALVVKIGTSEDLNARASDFVNQLVNAD
jgi:flavodoxin